MPLPVSCFCFALFFSFLFHLLSSFPDSLSATSYAPPPRLPATGKKACDHRLSCEQRKINRQPFSKSVHPHRDAEASWQNGQWQTRLAQCAASKPFAFSFSLLARPHVIRYVLVSTSSLLPACHRRFSLFRRYGVDRHYFLRSVKCHAPEKEGTVHPQPPTSTSTITTTHTRHNCLHIVHIVCRILRKLRCWARCARVEPVRAQPTSI